MKFYTVYRLAVMNYLVNPSGDKTINQTKSTNDPFINTWDLIQMLTNK